MLNLDTHILLHAINGSLNPKELKLLTENAVWSISAIVLWEIETLYRKRRIGYGLDHPPMAEALRRLHIWPLSLEVCLNLSSLDFSSDPADEIIAATSLTHSLPLLTRDARIRRSKLIRCL
ncbi:MAG: PIN domain-containing protein [Bryobacteraceae bacterium]